MTTNALLSAHQLAHALFGMVTAELPNEVADRTLPGACISGISPIFAHIAFGEDFTVNTTLRGGPTILERDGWADLTGIPGPFPAMTPESLSATFDVAQLRSYAADVFANTERYLADPPASDFAKLVTSPLGTQVTGEELLTSFSLVHFMLHTGEIAALKGVQGAPGGLPF
jgi:hypothetical protein